MLAQQRLKVVTLHRRSAVETLKLIAAFVAQRIKLMLFLYAFSDNFHRQAVRHGNNGAGDREVVAVMR